MPKMGESVMEATITKWLKNEGDRVEMDEIIVEIATDKVDSEVPSTTAGILVKKVFRENDVVKIGEAFALIDTGEEVFHQLPVNGNRKESIPSKHEESVVAENPPVKPEEFEPAFATSAQIEHSEEASSDSQKKFYSPLIRNIARQEGISLQELDKIPGSGKDGRLTKDDLMAYLAAGRQIAQSTPVFSVSSTVRESKSVLSTPEPLTSQKSDTATKETVKMVEPKPMPVFPTSGDEIIEMNRMRKLIADHMVMSKRVSPHVTSFVEVDMTNIVLWRERIKEQFYKDTGEKITFTPIIIEAVVQAIKQMPGVNASVDGDKIILRKNINIGMATALPNGNLIVPVIKNADMMNLVGLTRTVNDLANRARLNKLLPDEVQGGTYTVSNVGSFGNVMGTPIINQPQVAILAIGVIRKKPAVIETPAGDVIAIRHMMFLSHSYDHRVVDGALGGSFVRKVADILESFPLDRSY